MKGKQNGRCKSNEGRRNVLHDGSLDRDVAAVVADTGRLYRRSHFKAMAEAQRQEQNLRNAE